MTTAEGDRTLVEDVLACGMDDWVDVNLIVNIAWRLTNREAEATTVVCLGLIAEVLFRGLMVPGRTELGGFHAWEISAAQAFDLIARSWLSRGSVGLLPGDIAWFDLTDAGAAIGRAVLEREGKA